MRELTEALYRGRFEFVVEADIKGFFDHLRHDWLIRMLEQRINDGALIRLVRKWLRAGMKFPGSGAEKNISKSPVHGTEFACS